MSQPDRRDLLRLMLEILLIGGLAIASLWVLRPFIPAIIWATTIVVATWPLLIAAQQWLRGSRALAVTAMTLGMLVVIVAPLAMAIGTLVEHASEIAALFNSLKDLGFPPPPDWVARIPVVGQTLAEEWAKLAASDRDSLVARITPYVGEFVRGIGTQLGNVGMTMFHLLLTLIVAGILYATGESAGAWMIRFARRIAGDKGEDSVRLGAQAVRAVALGVVVTALAQSAFAGIGLAIAGVPYAAVLTAVMFMLGVAQIGAVPVMVLAVIWLYWKGDPMWGTFLLVWTVIAGGMDNILRPVLIKRGANLPLLLIFAGVIGGLIAFGIIGLFIGPVVLAVTYTLLLAWVDRGEAGAPPASGQSG